MGIDNEWIEWAGGECPVADCYVEVKHRPYQHEIRQGIKQSAPVLLQKKADAYRWTHKGFAGDIVAYRVVSK